MMKFKFLAPLTPPTHTRANERQEEALVRVGELLLPGSGSGLCDWFRASVAVLGLAVYSTDGIGRDESASQGLEFIGVRVWGLGVRG